MNWQALHTAPREGEPIWLFLPAFSWTSDAQGRPTSVKHAVVVAHWDKERLAWINRDGGAHVYPSLWNDAPVDGPAPASPLSDS